MFCLLIFFCFQSFVVLLSCGKIKLQRCVPKLKSMYELSDVKLYVSLCIYVYVCIESTKKFDFETLTGRDVSDILFEKKLLSNVYISFSKST